VTKKNTISQPEAEAPDNTRAAGPEGEVVEGEVIEAGPELAEVEEQPAEQPDLAARLEEAEARAAQYLDGWQRARAELDNYRKRVDRERHQRETELREETILRLLPVVDDFDLVLANLPAELAESEWAQAVQMVHRKLTKQLEDLEVREVEAQGVPFNPALHEAVMQAESDAHKSGEIIDVLRKGYTLKGKVIRPALVRVAQ